MLSEITTKKTENKSIEKRRSFNSEQNDNRDLFIHDKHSLTLDNSATVDKLPSGNKTETLFSFEELRKSWDNLLNKELPGSSQMSQGEVTSKENITVVDNTSDISNEKNATLDTSTEKLQNNADTVEKLVNWNVKGHFAEWLRTMGTQSLGSEGAAPMGDESVEPEEPRSPLFAMMAPSGASNAPKMRMNRKTITAARRSATP